MPFPVDVTSRLSMLEGVAAGSVNRREPLYIERSNSVEMETS